ncbi:MBL fold metallo-hydrolase [soil metagenome]
MSTNRYYRGPASDHFDGTRFFNPDYPSTDRGLRDVLKWKFGGKPDRWEPAPRTRQVVPQPSVQGLRVTLVGHASVLVQAAGRNYLFDPVWSERVSPLRFAGPRRFNPPAMTLEQLPRIDAVFVSHNHYDHLDMRTLQWMWRKFKPAIVAPLGNDAVIRRSDRRIAVTTLDWHEGTLLDDETQVFVVPANHWSNRWLGDRRMALWGGFYLKTAAGSVYFAGDTGYGDGRVFREIRERYGDPDVALLPIGAYAPRWFMQAQHVDPREAVQIARDCGAGQSLGLHWGTFRLTDESAQAPQLALETALDEAGMPRQRFLPMQPGDVWSVAK